MWILILLGKILLWLLILLVLLAILILFWPIRYRLKGFFSDNKPVLHAKVTWLCGLIRICFDYPEEKEPRIQILFFTIRKKQDKQHTRRRRKPIREEQSRSSEPGSQSATPEPEVKTLTQEKEEHQTQKVNWANSSSQNPDMSDAVQTDSREAVGASSEEGWFSEWKARIKKLQYTIQTVYDKMTHIREEYLFYRGLWENTVIRGYITDAFFLIWKVIKKLLPQKVKVTAHIGTGACDSTGYMMGVYGIVMNLLPPKYLILLEPDFERRIVDGNFDVRGHISVFSVLAVAIRLFFDKRLRMIRSILKKHNSENKHVQESTGME